LSPGSQHDQLVVSGPATLDGALQVWFTNGFAPQLGDFLNTNGVWWMLDESASTHMWRFYRTLQVP
jgi:hypothetical protein